MDCDLFFTNRFFNLEELLEYDVAANCVELGNMLYPSHKDRFLRNMIAQDQTQFLWNNTHAFDVSFLYIGNEDLREKYSNLAFKWMEELSIRNPNDPMLNGNYMIFCEQKILKEFTDLMNLKSVLLCPDLKSIDGKNDPLPDPYKTMGGSDFDYFHLGPLKRKAEDNPNLTLDIRSRIIKSMVDLNNPHIKLAFLAGKKNSELY